MSKPPSTDAAYRPLSPHLQVWKFHITMFTSILHRITGVATAGGVLLGAVWLLALGATAAGLCPEAYTTYLTFAASPFGLLVWFGLTLAGFVHLTGGLRHLIWDLGHSFLPKQANALSWWTLILGIVAAILFWIGLFVTGNVVL